MRACGRWKPSAAPPGCVVSPSASENSGAHPQGSCRSHCLHAQVPSDSCDVLPVSAIRSSACSMVGLDSYGSSARVGSPLSEVPGGAGSWIRGWGSVRGGRAAALPGEASVGHCEPAVWGLPRAWEPQRHRPAVSATGTHMWIRCGFPGGGESAPCHLHSAGGHLWTPVVHQSKLSIFQGERSSMEVHVECPGLGPDLRGVPEAEG